MPYSWSLEREKFQRIDDENVQETYFAIPKYIGFFFFFLFSIVLSYKLNAWSMFLNKIKYSIICQYNITAYHYNNLKFMFGTYEIYFIPYVLFNFIIVPFQNI